MMETKQILYVIANCMIVFLLGFIYSYTELLSKYKQSRVIFRVRAGWFYMLFNGFFSLIIYFLLKEWNFSLLNLSKLEGGKIIIAGTAAIVVLRSSIVTIKTEKNNIEGGLSPLIQILLDYVNRSFDRHRSRIILPEIHQTMQNVNFAKASIILPIICLRLMKTLSQTEQEQLGADIAKINEINADNSTKSLTLGIILHEYTDSELLKVAVEKLGSVIQ
jgi:hypothetical protein